MIQLLSRASAIFPESALTARRMAARVKKSHETPKLRQPLENTSALLSWLGISEDDVRVTQFTHGQSNPTYVVRAGSRKIVVRKQPPGKLLKGAHDVGREHALVTSLSKSRVPTPKPIGYCDDATILGTPFWAYDYVDGRHFKDAYLEEAPVEEREELMLSAAKTAAALHSAKVSDELIERLGGVKEKYLERQLRTWTKQYKSADEKLGTTSSEQFERVSKGLALAVEEAGDDVVETATCVAHGDLRCDNMIFESNSSGVVALLDWELGTIGHPASDLAYLCMPYYIPPLPVGPMSGFEGLDMKKHGIPTQDAVKDAYVNALTREDVAKDVSRAVPHLDLFAAVAYFRLASIVRGVYARAKAGNAAASNAAMVGSLAETLLQTSGRLEARHRASTRRAYSTRVREFVDEHVIPVEKEILERTYSSPSDKRWQPAPELEGLKAKAKEAGLWNLFLLSGDGPYQLATPEYPGGGLSLLEEYADVCEETGRSLLAPEVFNCSAPDTGNMEVLAQFGTEEQKKKWLAPLLAGDIRSCYGMTEPQVASSDPTNLEATIRDVGNDELVVNGRKWWTSGALDPRCEVCIFMGRAEGLPDDAPRHARHSMVLVPMSAITVVRPLRVFGFDDAPHGHAEIELKDVVVKKSEAILLGHGDAFKIAQARLGPGRVHHCMRTIGACERALELTKERLKSRVAFGGPLAAKGSIRQDIAQARIKITQARLLVQHCARQIDQHGNKAARKDIAMIKVAVPQMACVVLDSLMQMWGGEGLSTDTPLAHMYASARVLRQADGPDEVHMETIAKLELQQHQR